MSPARVGSTDHRHDTRATAKRTAAAERGNSAVLTARKCCPPDLLSSADSAIAMAERIPKISSMAVFGALKIWLACRSVHIGMTIRAASQTLSANVPPKWFMLDFLGIGSNRCTRRTRGLKRGAIWRLVRCREAPGQQKSPGLRRGFGRLPPRLLQLEGDDSVTHARRNPGGVCQIC